MTWVLNPKFTVTDRMAEINRLMAPLEDQLDAARVAVTSMERTADKNGATVPSIELVRDLRRQLAALGKEYWDISLEVNKDYHNMKPLNRLGQPKMYKPTPKEIESTNKFFKENPVKLPPYSILYGTAW